MRTRRIIFSSIAIDAHIGILEHELLAAQQIHVDAELEVDIKQSVNDSDIASVLDYRTLHDAIIDECTRGHVNLLETLTDRVAVRLLNAFTDTREVLVRITKPTAFSDAAGVAIEVRKNRDV